MLYNISPYDLKNSQIKIDKQKDYLSSNTFTTKSGSVKTLLDVSMSANISSRYYAQLVNKVNTLQQVMTNEDLVPVFLTITLDGVYHDLLFGDYSRITEADIKKLPKATRFKELRQKAQKKETFTVNDLYQYLRFQWNRFQSSRIYTTIKASHNLGYLFSVEPHNSGVPHAHVLLYVPYTSIQSLKNQFMLSCPARLNVTQDKSRLSPIQIANGEINGFQWTISNPVGYVMKYCVKSFMDLKNQSEIDELQAWYIKNKIIRITTSQTLVPQWVYNKVYPLESDWLYLSDLKLRASCEWSQEDDFFQFEDTKLNKVLKYEKGLYQYFQDGELVHQFGQMREPKEINTMRQEDRPISSSRPRPLPYPITINNIVFHSFLRSSIQRKTKHKKKNYPIQIIYPNGLTINVNKVSASKMNSRDLLELYYSFNLETCDLKHFGVIKNECIKRNLINGLILPINEFSTNIENINEVNPYEIEMDRARTFFICRESIISLLSVNNIIQKIGA